MALESLALDRFDRLNKTGELLWKEVEPRHLAAQPFDFEFRVAESLIAKPQDKEQKQPPSTSAKGAFEDDDPDFELGKIGDRHRLILNKFSVVRPQFVLPTIAFEPQKDPLNSSDIEAVWEVICSLSDKYLAIFNCGIDAGSSVGHKHLQVIPLPQHHQRGFLPQLLEQMKAEEGRLDSRDLGLSKDLGFQPSIAALKGAPFKHAAARLPNPTSEGSGHPTGTERTPSASEVFAVWRQLCAAVRLEEGQAHNLLLTKDLIVVVPRTKAWMGEGETEFSCNAASIAGIVWCKTEAQYNAWLQFGPMKALREFGVDADS